MKKIFRVFLGVLVFSLVFMACSFNASTLGPAPDPSFEGTWKPANTSGYNYYSWYQFDKTNKGRYIYGIIDNGIEQLPYIEDLSIEWKIEGDTLLWREWNYTGGFSARTFTFIDSTHLKLVTSSGTQNFIKQ